MTDHPGVFSDLNPIGSRLGMEPYNLQDNPIMWREFLTRLELNSDTDAQYTCAFHVLDNNVHTENLWPTKNLSVIHTCAKHQRQSHTRLSWPHTHLNNTHTHAITTVGSCPDGCHAAAQHILECVEEGSATLRSATGIRLFPRHAVCVRNPPLNPTPDQHAPNTLESVQQQEVLQGFMTNVKKSVSRC